MYGTVKYSVKVTDALGCVLRDSLFVPEADPASKCDIDLNTRIFIPNAFSPNDDAINDVFTVHPKFGLIKSVSFRIYDRWGNFIFQSEEIDEYGNTSHWEGRNYETGVYVCAIEVILSDESVEYLGEDFVLVR